MSGEAGALARGMKSLVPGKVPRMIQGTILEVAGKYTVDNNYNMTDKSYTVQVGDSIITGVRALEEVYASPGVGCWMMSMGKGQWLIIGTRGDYTPSKANLIHNGGHRVDQRATTMATSAGTIMVVDRWWVTAVGGAQVECARITASAPNGSRAQLKATVTTADASIAAGDYAAIGQAVEGWDAQPLKWGSTLGNPATLSFWVRASVAGQRSVSLRNNGSTRSFVATFTIDTANVWQYVVIQIPPDQTGSWIQTTALGIQIWFGLGQGSTYATSSLNTWLAGNYVAATGDVNLISTLNSNMYLSEVKLEVGNHATPFVYPPYSEELAVCQRYLYIIGGDSAYQVFGAGGSAYTGTACNAITPFPQQMRATPTIYTSGNFRGVVAGAGYAAGGGQSPTISAVLSGRNAAWLDLTTVGNFTAGHGSQITANNDSNARMHFMAELQ